MTKLSQMEMYRLPLLLLKVRSCESSEATVTPILKTPWKLRVSKWDISKSPVFHVLNFLGWIYLIYDKIT